MIRKSESSFSALFSCDHENVVEYFTPGLSINLSFISIKFTFINFRLFRIPLERTLGQFFLWDNSFKILYL